jgi:hypothetical protein
MPDAAHLFGTCVGFLALDDSGKIRCKRLILEVIIGAGNETRTRDLNLGKVALYQLSYSRPKQRAQL